jgi:hypothetical protein
VSSKGGAIPQHHSFINLHSSHVDASKSASPDLEFKIKDKHGKLIQRKVYDVQGETITLSGYIDKTLNVPSSPTTDEPFASVATLKRFCPTCKPLPDYETPSDLIGARLDDTDGTVLARGLTPCEWEFAPEKPGDQAYKTRMPREVAITLTVPKALVVKLSSAGGSRSIVVKPGGILTLGSATVEDMMRVGVEVDPAHDSSIDHHFELFYHLLEGSNAAKHPLPEKAAGCFQIRRPNGVDCPPVQQ